MQFTREQTDIIRKTVRALGYDGPDNPSATSRFLVNNPQADAFVNAALAGAAMAKQSSPSPMNKTMEARRGFATGGQVAGPLPPGFKPPSADSDFGTYGSFQGGYQSEIDNVASTSPATAATMGEQTYQDALANIPAPTVAMPDTSDIPDAARSSMPSLPIPQTDPAPTGTDSGTSYTPSTLTPTTTSAPSTPTSAASASSPTPTTPPATPTTSSSQSNAERLQEAIDKGFRDPGIEGYEDKQEPIYKQKMVGGTPMTLGIDSSGQGGTDDFDKYFEVKQGYMPGTYEIRWKSAGAALSAPEHITEIMGGRPSTYTWQYGKMPWHTAEGTTSRLAFNSSQDAIDFAKSMPLRSKGGDDLWSEAPIPAFKEDGTPDYEVDAMGNLIIEGYDVRPADIGSMLAQDTTDPGFAEGEAFIPTMTAESEDQYLDAGGAPVQDFDPETGQLLYNEDGSPKYMTDEEGNIVTTPTMGMVGGAVAVDPTTAGTYTADATTETDANVIASGTGVVGDTAVENALAEYSAATGTSTDMAAAEAATEPVLDANGQPVLGPDGQPMMKTKSDVQNLQAAQGTAAVIDSAATRTLQDGEQISAAADAVTAATHIEAVQAAQASPSQEALVKTQVENLTANFDASNPPAWAAGAIRAAKEEMARRGVGASSMYGQAIVQRSLEMALPIAQADAKTIAGFEIQNLSNRQAMQMVYAEQRAAFMGMQFDQEFQARVANAAKISDIANKNFTAEQQVILENAKMAQSMEIKNLTNKQALVMAEAASIAALEQSTLDNRQKAAVANAQHALAMDMTNVNNEQQMEIFKATEQIQAMFADKAAEFAAAQFNATSQNQVDQFFANLAQATNQFNATQLNAQEQFNAGQINTVERFNAELNNQRDQFNATNQVVIAQSNANWKRQIATADTAAINRANETNAKNLLDISQTAYENLWQYYGDTMNWAWTSMENERERTVKMAVAELNAGTQESIAAAKQDYESSKAFGGLVGTVLGSVFDSFF